jgi:hypothetical protein
MIRADVSSGEVPCQVAIELGLGLQIIEIGEREMVGKA